MDVSHASQLNDEFPSIVFQGSCLNATPVVSNNLAYSLLQNGAVCTVGATERSWFNSAYIENKSFVPGLLFGCSELTVVNRLPVGDVVITHKYIYTPYSDTAWQNYIVFNLLGCPAVGIHSVRFAGPRWSF